MHKKLLNHSFKAAAIAAMLSLSQMGAHAAGLGRITVLSALGQPLRAEVELSASREEISSLSARVAPHEAFRQAGIEYVPALASIKLVVDKRSGGQPIIRMTTDRPINEPFLDLLIELNWTAGRLVREYTFLLDPVPEVMAQKQAVAPAERREAAPVAKPSPVTAPKQPEVRATAPVDDKLLAKPAGDAQTREVRKGDYLRKIAAETQYEGVSLDQMLVAIFRHNKDAFMGDNLHRLKAGKILSIPDRDAAGSVDAQDARKTISVHTADFNAYRQKLASAAAGSEAPKEAAAKQVATGKIGAKVEEKAPAPSTTQDRLRVSKADSPSGGQAAQGRIASLEEDIVAKDRALKEALSRQAELERNLGELQKILELKSRSLADLQKQAVEKTPQVAAAPQAADVKKPETPVQTAPEKAPEPAPAATPAEPSQAKPAEGGKPAEESKPAEAAKPADMPKPEEIAKAEPKKAPVPPPPLPEPDFIDELLDNPAILGGGVLVLGLLGLIAYRQRQKKQKQESGEAPTTTANLTANSVFGATGGQSVDTTASSMATDFSQASVSAIDADEGVDPVAEADVYMAYGRDAQAEEILLDALKSDPTRTAIHVKLLEIYAGRKNSKQFETLASDLYAQTGGVGGDWEKAAAMGMKLDPANPLYGGEVEGGQSIHTDATVVMPAGAKQLRDTWTMPGEMSQISEAVEKGTATGILERPEPAAAETPAAPASSLDFDLDLGAPSSPPAEPAPAAASVEAPALDFDLGLDFKPAEGKTYNPEATVVLDVTEPVQGPAADLELDIQLDATPARADKDELDFNLDLGEPDAPAAPADTQIIDLEKTFASGKGLDFDFDIGEPPASEAASPQAVPELDLGGISLDLGEAVVAADTADGDEVATKLELAKAYEEMGDKEGARELLTEVANEGNAEQQARAQSMLAKLG